MAELTRRSLLAAAATAGLPASIARAAAIAPDAANIAMPKASSQGRTGLSEAAWGSIAGR